MMLLWQDVKNLNGGLSALFESDLKIPEYRVHLLTYYHPFLSFLQSLLLGLGGVEHEYSCDRLFAVATSEHTPYECLSTTRWSIFAFEVMSTAYMAINSIGIDTVFGLFSLHMVGELRLSSYYFRCLKPGDNYRRDLKDCIDRHCLLVDYKYMLDKVFGFISAWLALSCAIIICSLIFQITQSKKVSLFQIFFAVDYITAKLLQAYTFAWFDNTITVESERCVESIYYCRWVESDDLRIIKDVLIIQSQSPMYINSMGVMIVQLDMFMKIARASISYFFLLKTIEEKLTSAS